MPPLICVALKPKSKRWLPLVASENFSPVEPPKFTPRNGVSMLSAYARADSADARHAQMNTSRTCCFIADLLPGDA